MDPSLSAPEWGVEPHGAVEAGGVAPPVTGPEVALSSGALRRRIGDSDLEVFPLALSGNVFGWTADVVETERILDRFLESGADFIDTADSYAGGRSEIMIGNWLRSRRNRDGLVLATKVGKGPDHPGVTASSITAAVEDSLRRLRTDRVDLLYLHIDDPEIPFEQTLLAVDELIRAGKVRYFGASDHSGDRLLEARVASAQLGIARMVALQSQYHLMARGGYELGLAQVARDLDLAVMPRFPLASGFLTAKYRSRADAAGSDRERELSDYFTRTGSRVLAALDGVAAALESTPASVALAWLLTKPNVVAPVVSASRAEQLSELLAAAQLTLSRHQILELDRASG